MIQITYCPCPPHCYLAQQKSIDYSAAGQDEEGGWFEDRRD
jgi:hypothetical protein